MLSHYECRSLHAIRQQEFNQNHNYLPPVSKVAVVLMRVHMTGTRFMAVQMARTRSLSDSGNRQFLHMSHKRRSYTLDVTIRRPHYSWSNTENVVDDLFGPAKFSYYLFIAQSGQRIMAPGMNGDLMTGNEFLLQKRGKGNDAGTHDKHGREKVILA